jgi:hypothetical protein
VKKLTMLLLASTTFATITVATAYAQQPVDPVWPDGGHWRDTYPGAFGWWTTPGSESVISSSNCVPSPKGGGNISESLLNGGWGMKGTNCKPKHDKDADNHDHDRDHHHHADRDHHDHDHHADRDHDHDHHADRDDHKGDRDDHKYGDRDDHRDDHNNKYGKDDHDDHGKNQDRYGDRDDHGKGDDHDGKHDDHGMKGDRDDRKYGDRDDHKGDRDDHGKDRDDHHKFGDRDDHHDYGKGHEGHETTWKGGEKGSPWKGGEWKTGGEWKGHGVWSHGEGFKFSGVGKGGWSSSIGGGGKGWGTVGGKSWAMGGKGMGMHGMHVTTTTTHSGGSSGGSNIAAGYVGSAIACSAVSLIARGAVQSYTVGKPNSIEGEIPPREAMATVAGCFVPFVGGYIVDKIWNPAWDHLYVDIKPNGTYGGNGTDCSNLQETGGSMREPGARYCR